MFCEGRQPQADRRQVNRWPKTPDDKIAEVELAARRPEQSTTTFNCSSAQAPGRLPISCALEAQFHLKHPPAANANSSPQRAKDNPVDVL